MACELKKLGGYGTGALGDITNPSGQINSYARVQSYTNTTVTIGSPSNGIYEKFTNGNEIMLHVSATNGSSQEYKYLGKYLFAKIVTASGTSLTIDGDFTKVLPLSDFSKYQVQAITTANFKTLMINQNHQIAPPTYNVSLCYGGIILIKCTQKLDIVNGRINLESKGIPYGSTQYRPETTQERQGRADTDRYSGWENHVTIREFLLNCGDGAAMIIARSVNTGYAGYSGIIGGTASGQQFQRGNTGGSTIALVAGEFLSFTPGVISKNRGHGRGLGRCYIASNTKLRNDEGLYAYDCISSPIRLRSLNIKNYGDRSLGDITNPTSIANNYASITRIEDDKTILYTGKTSHGMAPIGKDSLIMIHVSKTTDYMQFGRFFLARVLSDNGTRLVIDTSLPADIKRATGILQIVSVAQFNSLTLTKQWTPAMVWNGLTGGICAIACGDFCDITNGGGLNVEHCGGGSAYGRAGLAFIGNAQMANTIPIGEGHGSVFLLTKTLRTSSNSRIGASYDGAAFGGWGGWNTETPICGGYAGRIEAIYYDSAGGGYNGGGEGGNNVLSEKAAGCGAYGGSHSRYPAPGGYGGNGAAGQYSYKPGVQGAHLFIVADKITEFNQSVFSTGGNRGYGSYGSDARGHGGAGYGGSGSNDGGGGGSSGWAFIYCNKVETEDLTGVVI